MAFFSMLSHRPWLGWLLVLALFGGGVGLGTLLGPVVGAITIIGLENQLADKVGSWVGVIMGVIFVICVLAFRRGLVGEAGALWERLRKPNNARQIEH